MRLKSIHMASVALALSIGGTSFVATPAAADNLAAIKARMNPMCSEEAKNIVAESVRQTIEDSVARSEAAIRPPIPLGDLSCLTGLMNAPIDIFSGVGGIMGSLTQDLTGQISGLAGGLGDKICAVAAEKWSELTQPLTGALDGLGNLSFDVGNIWDSMDSSSGRGSNGSTGSQQQLPGGIGEHNAGEIGGSNSDQVEDDELTLQKIIDALNNGTIRTDRDGNYYLHQPVTGAGDVTGNSVFQMLGGQ